MNQIIVSVVCVLTYLLQAAITSASVRVISIRPDEPHSECPENLHQHCYTFNQLIDCNQLYHKPRNCSFLFGSNTETAFLPGVYTYSSESSHENTIFSISHAENIAFYAANASIGAVIRCKSNFALAFKDIVNLTIFGLKFEKCGAYGDNERFTILISRSGKVRVSNVTIANGKQVGLMLINVTSAILTNLNLIKNLVNIYILTEDGNGRSIFDPRPNVNITLSNSFLVSRLDKEQLMLLQTSFKVVIYLTNVTMEGGGLRVRIESPSYSSIVVKRLSANNTSDDIYFQRSWGTWSFGRHQTPVMFSYCNFTNNKLVIENNGNRVKNSPSDNEKSMIVVSNVQIQGSHHPIELINIKMVLHNTRIENNFGKFQLILQAVVLQVQGLNVFQQNYGGFQLVPHDDDGNIDNGCTLSINSGSKVIIKDNIITDQDVGSVLYARNSGINVDDNTTIVLDGNIGVVSGGITLINSTISIEGKSEAIFSRNIGTTGGAIAFFSHSELRLFDTSVHMYFIENHANKFGGAIFVNDNDYIIRTRFRTFYSEFVKVHTNRPPSLTFTNNTAQLSGTALYGGWIDALDAPAFLALKHLHNSAKDLSLVSSDATRICSCIASVPRCESEFSHVSLSTVPGQTYTIQLVAVGQRFGTVVSTVQGQFTTNLKQTEEVGELAQKEYVQDLETTCTDVTLTVKSLKSLEQLVLNPVNYNSFATTILKIALNNSRLVDKNVHSELFFKDLKITFNLKECPWGFYLNKTLKQCSCEHALQTLGIYCDLEEYKVLRPTPRWIGTTYKHTFPFNKSGFLIHQHCPFDYCKVTDIPISLNLGNLDDQCALDHSGILCGSCQENLSHVLGTSQCLKCSKPWIALIIPLVAIAGFILVAVLIFLNLTVSVGTLNGLIFYANILRANHAVFIPPNISNSFLSTFIAWLNLDLGIETCFYDGFDAYAKTWFQFLFPLYIWLLVAAIIIASHYSTIASRLSGNNAVQVLATLFLLSYGKLLRTIITIFTSTELVYPDGYRRRVWLYDGNIDYFKRKHIALCVAGLITLIFISAPYTTVLLCIQWLQKYSSCKMFFLVRKLHPLIDAYTGPYKSKHRYWTGFLLLVRVCLFLIFSLNPYDDPTPVNILATFVTSLSLLTYLSLIKGVYKRHGLNVLENVFLLNLGILSATVGLYRNNTDNTVSKISYASTGSAFLIFVLVIFYHLFIKFTTYRRVKTLGAAIVGKLRKLKKVDNEDIQELEVALCNPKPDTVTYSVVRLSEHLVQAD